MVKNPLASAGDAGDRVGFDPWVEKIPLEKEMATHSSILAWRIPWTKESGSPQSRKELDMIEVSVHTHGKLLTTAHDLRLLPGSSVKLDILKSYGFLSSFSFFLSFFFCVYIILSFLSLSSFSGAWSLSKGQGSNPSPSLTGSVTLSSSHLCGKEIKMPTSEPCCPQLEALSPRSALR